MRKVVEGHGGRFLWTGRVTAQVIGAGGEGFEVAALVEYPSRKVFVEIATGPDRRPRSARTARRASKASGCSRPAPSRSPSRGALAAVTRPE